jgi:hypothetical protein
MALKIAPPEPDTADTGKRRHEIRALWRFGAWGAAAAIALTAVAIVAQTNIGAARLQLAITSVSEPMQLASAPVPPHLVERVAERAIENEAATRHLAAEVRTLTTDRDRLAVRLASLEQKLVDMTGTIKRQAAQAAAAPAAALAPRAPIAAMPVPSTPANTPPAKADTTDYAAPLHDQPQSQNSAAVSKPVPLPPTRIAAAPAHENAAEPPPKPEFGVALAGASSLEVMRLQWTAVKANFGPLLAGLHPRALYERRNGTSHYRLVLGPLPDHATAVKLCGRLIAARAICNPAKFAGEPL